MSRRTARKIEKRVRSNENGQLNKIKSRKRQRYFYERDVEVMLEDGQVVKIFKRTRIGRTILGLMSLLLSFAWVIVQKGC